MTKTITNTKELIDAFNLKVNEEDVKKIDLFFKKKVMHIENNKIVYPKLEVILRKEKELSENIKDIEKEIAFWKKNRNKMKINKKLSPITMYFKKNFWRHKIKELTNKEYKQDVIDTKLTDKILLDPEYKKLFETFIINPDYRQKLKETINNSIVYKHNGIGLYGDRKKEFRINTSQLRIKQLNKQIKEIKIKKEVFSKIYEIMKKNV
jgi:hypothetical protein